LPSKRQPRKTANKGKMSEQVPAAEAAPHRPPSPIEVEVVNAAATDIQKIVRGHHGRIETESAKTELEEKIQSDVEQEILGEELPAEVVAEPVKQKFNPHGIDEDDSDDESEMPEWIKAFSPRGNAWYFYNQNSGIKRTMDNAPSYFKYSPRLSYDRLDRRFGASWRIQLAFRIHRAKSRMRLQRGRVLGKVALVGQTEWAAFMETEPAPKRTDTGKAEEAPAPEEKKGKKYYFNVRTEECRWEKPASILYVEEYKPLLEDIQEVSVEYNAMQKVLLYKRDSDALDAIGEFSGAFRSAEGKANIIGKRQGTITNDVLEDKEEFHASIELLERAIQNVHQRYSSVEGALRVSQGHILDKFSNQIDDYEGDLLKNEEELKYWPNQTRSTVQGMIEEVGRACNTIIDWWAENSETIPGDVLAYLHPDLAKENGTVPTIDRENSIPVHPTIEELGKRFTLLEQVIEKAKADGFDTKEKQNEARELTEMRSNEAELRVLLFRKKLAKIKEEKQQKFYSQCRASWKKGLDMRKQDDQVKKSDNDLPLSKRHHLKIVQNVKDKIIGVYPDPWSALEGGCTKRYFKKLVAEEAERRHHQEKRVFHVDDPEHDTGKRLLHCACFWGRDGPVKALIELGADVNRLDGVLTKFTPMHECARSGQARIGIMLLESGALPSLSQRNIHGDTPIHVASRSGYWLFLDTVFTYLKAAGMGHNLREMLISKNGKRRTPRQVATVDSVRELLYDTEMEMGLLQDNNRRGKASALSPIKPGRAGGSGTLGTFNKNSILGGPRRSMR
jgi:hypothetical protein